MKTKQKILILSTIIFIIVGIWFFKNKPTKEEVSDDSQFDITYDFDIEKLKANKLPMIIAFGSSSCVPCQELKPILQELSKEYENKVIIKFVDISKNSDVAMDFPIKVVPTLFFFNKDGSPFESDDLIMYSSKKDNKHIFTAYEGKLGKSYLEQILKEMGVK